MTRIAMIALLAAGALNPSYCGRLLAQEVPKQKLDKAKIEFFWMEKQEIEGVTKDEGYEYSEGGAIGYLHKKPALVVTAAEVEEVRLANHDLSKNGLSAENYNITIHLTKQARKKLAANVWGEGKEMRLLTFVIDGKEWGLMRYEIDEHKKGVPPQCRAEAFTPTIGFFSKRAKAQRVVDALSPQVKNPLDEELQLLRRNGIASDTNSILDFLRRQTPSEAQQREVDALIKQLSSAKFADRESATKKLLKLGPVAGAKLVLAAKSKDREIAWRSEKLLKQLDSDEQQVLRDSLVRSALKVLKKRQDAKAVSVLMQTLSIMDDAQLQGLALEAIWTSTNETHAALFQKALADEDQHKRAAAIVGLELALGDQAVATLTPYLNHESAVLRLATTRALVDRRPRESTSALVKLVADSDDEISWQADALLQMLTGKQMELSGELTLGEAWRSWSKRDLPTAKLEVPLGRRRLDLSAGRNSLRETFARSAKTLDKGYGGFSYEADNGGKASVVDGKLLINGDNDEGDQRLYITSDRMIGRAEWPKSVEVRAKLGGKAGNNYGWHVGVSIGRVKMLFHPGLGGGEFRAETTDEHDYLFGNEGMNFTPATGVVHGMSIKVTKSDDGAEFNVSVRDANSKSEFKRKFTTTNEQLGKFNRIGLERSGRRGADAIFDSVSIQLGR